MNLALNWGSRTRGGEAAPSRATRAAHTAVKPPGAAAPASLGGAGGATAGV